MTERIPSKPFPETPDLSPYGRGSVAPALAIYVSETEPSSDEKNSLLRWAMLALIAILLHIAALWLSPGWYRLSPPAPVEVNQIDPAKLAAIKNAWKQRGFVLAKEKTAPDKNAPSPKDANYESDRNRTVEKEMRARQTTTIPNVTGNPNAKSDTKQRAVKNSRVDPKKIPLSALSNFQGLPVPGRRPEEEREASQRRGGPGETGDQYLGDKNLPEGAENMLNTMESVYYTFYARLYDQIGPLWQSNIRSALSRKRLPKGEYLTQADVVFDPDGNYVETRILNSSGVDELDAAVHQSWARIPRFPNPPRDLIQSDGKIHMGWSFTVVIDDHLQWQYMPPERQY